MQVDFGALITDLDGLAIPASSQADAPPLTLGRVAVNALLVSHESDRQEKMDKYAMFKLAQKAHLDAPVAVTSEEVTMLKSRIALVYGPLVCGRARDILEGVQ